MGIFNRPHDRLHFICLPVKFRAKLMSVRAIFGANGPGRTPLSKVAFLQSRIGIKFYHGVDIVGGDVPVNFQSDP